jgi:hypothetical protein
MPPVKIFARLELEKIIWFSGLNYQMATRITGKNINDAKR